MKKGFSLLFAIIVLVLVAFVSVLALSLTSQTTEATSNQYLREQAKLLALSSTEYALLALSGHDHSQGCLRKVNINTSGLGTNDIVSLFDVNLSIMYIVSGVNPDTWCDDTPQNNQNDFRILSSSLDYNESNLTVVIDTIVSSKDDSPIYPPIREHRRMVQKP